MKDPTFKIREKNLSKKWKIRFTHVCKCFTDQLQSMYYKVENVRGNVFIRIQIFGQLLYTDQLGAFL